MTANLATQATLAEIKRHIANDRPESLRVTVFIGGADYTLATGTTEFGTVTVGDLLRMCENMREQGATFVLHR